MNFIRREQIISIGLAMFSMLFGAGSFIYPLQVGMESGNLTFYGIVGFIITAVCFPIAGLIAMLLFDGNYKSFYYRLGTFPGGFFLFISMMIIGPIIAIPRTVTLSHTMLAPFLPGFLQHITMGSSFVFAVLFLGITFLATYRENKIITILGNVISPLLLLLLAIIIGAGLWNAGTITTSQSSALEIFKTNFIRGYETLDLLAAMLFASIVLSLFKNMLGSHYNPRIIAVAGLRSGLVGILLLGIVYIGLSIIGMYHGYGLEAFNVGQLLHYVAFRVLGSHGAFFVGLAVFLACLSTAMALSAAVAEYIEHTLLRTHIRFSTALVMVLIASIPLATFGLDKVLRLAAGPIVCVGYPVLIVLTICNIAYKLFDFKFVKIPVLITFIATLISYIW